MTINQILIYTDGACEGNQYEHNFGGWAAIIQFPQERIQITGAEANTTNNRMELKACIHGLQKAFVKGGQLPIRLFTDSAYIVNCIQQKWYVKWQKNGWKTSKGTPVENQELWESLLILLQKGSVHVEKVAGHAGNKGNENADQLAVQAIAEFRKKFSHK